jgi:hypothetical protein
MNSGNSGRRGIEARAEDEVAVGFGDGDAGRVDRRGQPALHAGHAILHVHGGDVEVVAGGEGGCDRAGSAVGAGGTDVAHSLDAVDGLFKRNGDGLLDRVGIGAHVVAGHRHLRRRQGGIHGHGKVGNAHGSRKNDQQRADRGKNRPMNKEIYKQGLPSFSLAMGALWMPRCARLARCPEAPGLFLGARQRHHRHAVDQELGAETMTRSPTFNPDVME